MLSHQWEGNNAQDDDGLLSVRPSEETASHCLQVAFYDDRLTACFGLSSSGGIKRHRYVGV